MREKKENKRGLAGKYRGCAYATTNKKTLLRHFFIIHFFAITKFFRIFAGD